MIIIHNQFAIAWHSPHAAGVFQVVINHQIDAWHIQGSRATRSMMLVRVQRPGTIECEFWSDPFERPQNMDKMNKLKSQVRLWRSGTKYEEKVTLWATFEKPLFCMQITPAPGQGVYLSRQIPPKALVESGRSLYLGVLFGKRLFRSCHETIYNYFGHTGIPFNIF